MRITGNVSSEEVEVFSSVVHDAAEELCLRVRIAIEEGLDVDDLVGVVLGEGTPQIFPRAYFRERHCLAPLAAEALAEPHPGQLPVVILLRDQELIAVLWVWIHELGNNWELN